jgi:hypothetical protein
MCPDTPRTTNEQLLELSVVISRDHPINSIISVLLILERHETSKIS